MNRIKYNFQQTAALILSGMILAGCGSGDMKGYMPLAANPLYTYDIRTSQGDTTKRQRQVVEITGPYEAEGQILYLQSIGGRYQQALTRNEQGVQLIGDIHDQGLRFFDDSALVIPAELRVGDTWQGLDYSRLLEWRKHALEHADKSLHKPIPMQFECKATDEVVDTPAGRFRNVARIEGIGKGQFELGTVRDLNRIIIKITRWYAPGVGLIKSERKESSDTGLLIAGEEKRILEKIHEG